MRVGLAVAAVGVLTFTLAAVPSTASSRHVPAVTASLTPDSISGVAGETRTITLAVNTGATGKSIGSYSTTIVWDSTVVRLDSVVSGGFGSSFGVNYVNGGQVRLTDVSTSGATGSVTLARFYMRFVGTTIGARTLLHPTFGELTATDFSNLLADFSASDAVARIAPAQVIVRFNPDSLLERLDFKPMIALTADLSQTAGASLGSYAARVTWDSTVMRLDSVRAGDFASPQINAPNAAELRLTAADAQGVGGAPFTLARLFFHFASDTFPKAATLSLTVSEMHAARTFVDLLPGVSARNAKAVVGGVLRGDVDLSGAVAALDAQRLLEVAVGLALPAGAKVAHGDADCSGTLQARDAQIVLNHVVGNPVAQFCVGKIQ